MSVAIATPVAGGALGRPLQPTGKRVPVRPEVDTMMPGREGRLASEQLERRAQVPFAVGAADFGKHKSLLGYGSVLEAYWLPGPGPRAVIEKGDVHTFIRTGD